MGLKTVVFQNFMPSLPKMDEGSARFWSLMAILVFGAVFFTVLQLRLLDRDEIASGLSFEIAKIQAHNQALEQKNIELNRLNNALLPPENTENSGLDWETLRYLSFERFDLVAANEGIIFLNSEE